MSADFDYLMTVLEGYLEKLDKGGRGGVHMWQVTDKGREAVS